MIEKKKRIINIFYIISFKLILFREKKSLNFVEKYLCDT